MTTITEKNRQDVPRAYDGIVSGAVVVGTLIFSTDLHAAITLKTTEQPPLELFAVVLGGIGIFLTGIHFAGSHLQKITGGTFRNVVAAISERRLGVFSWGIFLGLFLLILVLLKVFRLWGKRAW